MRPRSEDPRKHQVLVRFTTPELEVLTAVAHLEDTTVAAYVYELVHQHVVAVASNEHVQADIVNRRKYSAARASTARIDRSGPVEESAGSG
jgi:hypothetical protein